MPDLMLWKDREIKRLKDELERAFSLVCEGLNCPDFKTAAHPLQGALHESSEAIFFDGVITGYRVEDINVEISEDSLVIAGCKREDFCDAEYALSGTFRTSYALPGKIVPEQSVARYRKGRLFVTMPRKRPGFHKMRIEQE